MSLWERVRSRVGALSRASLWGEGTGVRFRVEEPGELGREVASLGLSRFDSKLCPCLVGDGLILPIGG